MKTVKDHLKKKTMPKFVLIYIRITVLSPSYLGMESVDVLKDPNLQQMDVLLSLLSKVLQSIQEIFLSIFQKLYVGFESLKVICINGNYPC